MELTEFRKVSGCNVPEGVEIEKALPSITLSRVEDVVGITQLFHDYHYDISIIPVSFFKLFTKNAKEREKLKEEILNEIENLGLHDVVQASMHSMCFTDCFILNAQVIKAKESLVLEDGTTNSKLFSFGAVEIESNLEEEKAVESEATTAKSKIADMDPEDIEAYGRVQAILNLMKANNPDDQIISLVASNAMIKVIDKMKSKEYTFFPLEEVIGDCMFEGMEVAPADMFKVDQALKSAVAQMNEENKNGLGEISR